MQFFILAALLIGAVSAVPQPDFTKASLMPLEETENTIPDEYIVVFKETATEFDVQNHMLYLNNMLEYINGTYHVQHVYDMGPSFRGYAASMNEQMLQSVRGMQEVEYVERNQWGEWGELEKTYELQHPDEAENSSDDPDESEDSEESEDLAEESEDDPMESEDDLMESEDDSVESEDSEELEDPEDHELQELAVLDENWEQWGRRRCRQQKLTRANWALSRISHKNIQRGRLVYRYHRNAHRQGLGVKIYIIDSGIDVRNRDFGGRAKWGKTFSGGRKVDTVGHGTKVAGCAMSKTYGVAKRARAIAVKIDRNGKPSSALAIAAFNWVKKHHKRRKSVANASFHVSGRGVNAAATALVKSGIPLVAAAGNSKKNACKSNPASARRVIAVAASDRRDKFASFSNYGKCVNIIAPGVRIQTTGTKNRNPVTTNGTSFSAPYTSGVLATILSRRRMTPSKAVRMLYRGSLSGKIKKVPRRTRNLLLNSRC